MPSCSPTVSITISVSPRVFISVASAPARRGSIRCSRAPTYAPTNLPVIATSRISASSTAPSTIHSGQIDLEAGDDEEDRQQQEHADLFQPVEDLVAQPFAARPRHDEAEQERAEDHVYADPLGHEQDSSSPTRITASMSGVSRPARSRRGREPAQQRPDHRNMATTNGTASSICHDVLDGRTRDRHHHGEQRPRHHVVDGGAGQRETAELGAVHAPVGQDPGQHRERGHRHRRAQEQREREHAGNAVPVGEPAAPAARRGPVAAPSSRARPRPRPGPSAHQ